MSDPERASLLDQILVVSSRLEHLSVRWNVLRLCSKSNAAVHHLSLRVNLKRHDASDLVDMERLGQILPNLRCLQTSRGFLAFNDYLVRFIVTIVNTFERLVELVVNEEGRQAPAHGAIEKLKQTILSTGHPRLTNDECCQITFPKKNRVAIWLH